MHSTVDCCGLNTNGNKKWKETVKLLRSWAHSWELSYQIERILGKKGKVNKQEGIDEEYVSDDIVILIFGV